MIRTIVFAVGLAACLFAVRLPAAHAAAFQDAKPAASLPGHWHFVLDTPGGDRESEAEFHLDGNKVTGKYGKADVAGTFENGKLDLAFTIDTDEAGSGTLKLQGNLDGDSIKGDWAFTEYSGTFVATRKTGDDATPPKPPQAN